MSAFLTATGAVAIAEIGDKTQLLSFILAARFRKPLPIILGILVATLANHALAGAAGAWVMSMAGPGVLRWVLGVLFIAMAACASAGLPISTKAKPLERPVSRSIITLALDTAPYWLKDCSRSLSRNE